MDNESRDKVFSGKEDQAGILAKINEVMRRLGSSAEYKQLPKISGTEALEGKRITIVDDMDILLQAYMPLIISITNGEGDFVWHKGESAVEVANQIVLQTPDIVLVDFYLAKNIVGADVALALKGLGFRGVIIGFSSANFFETRFSKGTIDGLVRKNVSDPASSLRDVASFFRK